MTEQAHRKDATRDDYTWTMATKDLALSTRLTLHEAGQVTHQLAAEGLHPYDTLPLLVRLFGETRPDQRGATLAALIRLPRGEVTE